MSEQQEVVAKLTGDTYTFRGILKDHGWRWNGDDKAWEKRGTWEDENAVIREVRGYGGIRNRGSFEATLEVFEGDKETSP